MKQPLPRLLVALLGLASCSKSNAPDPAPTTPSIIGHWKADVVFATPLTGPAPTSVGTPGNYALDITANSITTTNCGQFIYSFYSYGSSAYVSSTAYTLRAPVLTFPLQTIGGTDSLLDITPTSFRWSHRDGFINGQPPYRLVAYFYR